MKIDLHQADNSRFLGLNHPWTDGHYQSKVFACVSVIRGLLPIVLPYAVDQIF